MQGSNGLNEDASSGAANAKGFRLDIQGLRGFALILVLACHAELPGAAGGYVGLDVFFVLSGFLITGLILTELDRRGSVSILRFYARRAKRLLPLAATVLVFTVIGSALLFSPLQSREIAGDVLAAALYVVNWHFIAESVDYFAFNEAITSPAQHYWSLSVEEQFYLLWPVLLGAAAALARRRGWSTRRTIGAAIVPLGLLSLLYSIGYTPEDPRSAYFSSLTRFWELALGGALALVLPAALRVPRAVSALLTAAGLALLVVTTLAFSGATPYPGWRALLPTLATVAIIVAGTATVASSPTRLLCRGAMQHLGKVSYAWYLWHWPVIVFAAAIWGELSVPALVLATLASYPLALLTHYAIEEPFRRSRSLNLRPRRALALGATCTAAALVVAIGLQWAQPTVSTAPAEEALGAEAVGPENPAPESLDAVRPNPVDAGEDRGPLWDDGCVSLGYETEPPRCEYGDPNSATTVVLFGDSHALQWFPTLRELAERRGWRLVGLARAGCVVAQVEYRPPCDSWRRKAMDRLLSEERPDLIVVSNSTAGRYQVVDDGERLSRDASQELLVAGFAETLRRLGQGSGEVVLIADQQIAPFNPPDCISRHQEDPDRCSFAVRPQPGRAFDTAGARRAGVRVIDPVPILCRDGRCRSVIGKALVYRDSYHLSATFARTLAPWLGRELPLR